MERALRAVCSHAWREVHSANTRIANACPPLPAQVLLGSSASAASRRRCQWGPCAGALFPPDEGLVEATCSAQCSVSVHIMCRCLHPCIGVHTNAPEPLTCMCNTCSDEPRLWQRKSTGLWRCRPEAETWVLGEGLRAELPEERWKICLSWFLLCFHCTIAQNWVRMLDSVPWCSVLLQSLSTLLAACRFAKERF